EQTDFSNPSGSLTINRGNASDTLTVNALPDFNASLTIGGASTQFSTVNFAGAVTLAANNNLAAFATSTISLAAAGNLAVSGTGTLGLTTARDITLASGSIITTVNGNVNLSANQTQASGNFAGIT